MGNFSKTVRSNDKCDRWFFHFIDLPPGEYTLTASLPGAAARYKNGTIAVTVPPVPPSGDNPSQPKFAFANLALSPSGIRGKVTDLEGVAIGRVNVKIQGSGESTVTNDEGKFQLIGLEAPIKEGSKRTANIVFSAKGYPEQTETLEFSLGEVVEKNISLTKQQATVSAKTKTSKKNNTS
ncbi:MAG: carboxypeptidase-like regulatory domain-containing protein [Oscillatoriales cyanobacterium RU_3_3]|nr:carboxypeptidase-like regulatory domain-containing protein [Oscillatoriales cyanobacterium RU_3_3]